MESRVLIVGVGNEDRGDDGIGLAVARRLQAVAGGRVQVVEIGGRADELLEVLPGCRIAILIDAAKSGSAPGTIHRFEAAEASVPTATFRASSHIFSVGEALELARILNKLPPSVVVYGIEGYDFELGHLLSPEVEAAVEKVVERVLNDLKRLGVGEAGG